MVAGSARKQLAQMSSRQPAAYQPYRLAREPRTLREARKAMGTGMTRQAQFAAETHPVGPFVTVAIPAQDNASAAPGAVAAFLSMILVRLVRLWVGAAAQGQVPQTPGRRIYYANHTSHLDALVILAALPADVRRTIHPLAANDYWGGTRLKRFMARGVLRSILVDRVPLATGCPLEPATTALAQGKSLLIFPEGTRGNGSNIAAFRSGLFALAERFPDCDIVPVSLENCHRVMPKGSIFPAPLLCSASFGPALRLQRHEQRREFLARARQVLIDTDISAEKASEPVKELLFDNELN